MTTDTVTLFFALLAIVAQLTVVAVAVVMVGGRRGDGALAMARHRLRADVGPNTLVLAAVVAAVCTSGSLYLSEVAHFPPCRLCWFQRIGMYPLVALLGLAAWRRDQGIRLYGIVLAVLGGLVSCWHLLVERFPTLEGTTCDPLNPCSIIWVEHLGYLTIPAMALSGFALIVALLAITPPLTEEQS